jgi:hypothetical protein
LPWQPPEYKKPTNEKKDKAAPAVDHKVLIPAQAEWQYWAGTPPKGQDWTLPEFDAAAWSKSAAPFGFGEGTFKTDLKSMRRKHTTVFLRKEFHIDQADRITELGLLIDYADGFIAYINGREVARSGVTRSSGRNAQGIKPREDHEPVYITLKDIYSCLKDGNNWIAIEGHVASEESLDFILAPSLIAED